MVTFIISFRHLIRALRLPGQMLLRIHSLGCLSCWISVTTFSSPTAWEVMPQHCSFNPSRNPPQDNGLRLSHLSLNNLLSFFNLRHSFSICKDKRFFSHNQKNLPSSVIFTPKTVICIPLRSFLCCKTIDRFSFGRTERDVGANHRPFVFMKFSDQQTNVR